MSNVVLRKNYSRGNQLKHKSNERLTCSVETLLAVSEKMKSQKK